MISDIAFVQHPVSVCVPPDHQVVLTVDAMGTGPLKYQWFDGSLNEVAGGKGAELVVTLQKSQLYQCRVSDQFCRCVFSEWAKVRVQHTTGPGIPEAWTGVPHIVVQPVSQTVRDGEGFVLQCLAYGMPMPQYQWYQNGHLLPHQTTGTLKVKKANADTLGSYLCAVSNVLAESWSNAADVVAEPALTATDKVALLIGNLNYRHHPVLMAPTMDVHQLGSLLQQLGFRVVSLLDLTLLEMHQAIEKFLQLLDQGVYAVFYYAGHGYEAGGRNYLVSIDAPRPYLTANCVCVQKVMRRMQETDAVLNVILLDTCRKWYKQDFAVSEIRPIEPWGNTVYGYATSEDAEAFEVQDGGRSTGIFTKYLNKHILQPMKVTHMLELVSEDLRKDSMVCGRQAVEIKHTLAEPRSLTDPVRTTGYTTELRLRDACWKQANVLPRQKLLNFACGVKVVLSFSALFSNVLVVFASVRDTGPTAVDCTVCLRSRPVLEDIFSGPGQSGEMDSLLFPAATPDCSLRLCCLQRLQTSLVIKVDLHYTHMDSLLRLTESRELDIGKPLVASWTLNRRTQLDGMQEGPVYSADLCRHHRHPPCQAFDQPFRPSTRKAEKTPKMESVNSNEPEENDERVQLSVLTFSRN